MKVRLIAGALGAAVFLGFVYNGSILFAGMILLLMLCGFNELIKLLKLEKEWPVLAWGSFAILMWFILNYLGYGHYRLEMAALLFYLITLLVLVRKEFDYAQASMLFMGTLTIAIGFMSFLDIRTEQGLMMTFYILVTIWATDSGAYFVGRAFGKTKLAESLSPNKTREGAIGGIVFAILVGVVFYFTTDVFDGALRLYALPLLIAILAQMGDLVESALKRQVGAKDSGKFLPGHGGLLDRFDSMLYVFPVLALFIF